MNLFLTKEALYRLSYVGVIAFVTPLHFETMSTGPV